MLVNLNCGPSLKLVKNNFYNYNKLSSELKELQTTYPDILTIQLIGKSYEGRAIFAVGLRGILPSKNKKPALMAIFTEHAAEHDVISLAMGIVKYLAKNYGKDKRITKLMNEKEVYIIPMMNPDGVEYDLSGEVKPFTWRKNRKPINEKNYGVDLNRNWGHKWDTVPEGLEKQYYSPNSDYYHGEKPFSENETTAIRNFLLSHNNTKNIYRLPFRKCPLSTRGNWISICIFRERVATHRNKKTI